MENRELQKEQTSLQNLQQAFDRFNDLSAQLNQSVDQINRSVDRVEPPGGLDARLLDAIPGAVVEYVTSRPSDGRVALGTQGRGLFVGDPDRTLVTTEPTPEAPDG